MSVQRTTCPICGRGPADKTLVLFESGRVHCHRGCDWRAIREALGDEPTARRTPASEPQRVSDEPLRWSDKAQAIWDRTHPLTGDDVASRYLLGRRCVLPENDVRWLPASDRNPWPCMVARVTDVLTREPLTLHFTRLLPDGSGKAPIQPAKILLGGHRKAGGVVRLSPDDAVTQGLALAEGIETALAVAHVHRPVWSCVDAANLAAFPVLEGIQSLSIFADNDSHGKGQAAAEQCARRWAAAGREAWIVAPENPGDWNDAAREVAA